MQREGAKPKAERTEDQPQHEPMRGSTTSIRRNPSTDQKKVRRNLSKKSGKDSCVGCGTSMIVPNGTKSPKCPTCVDGDKSQAWEDTQDSPFDQDAPRSIYNRRPNPDEVFDQKQSSLVVEATEFDSRADRLNPGDQIRTPTGQTTRVQKVRNHESSGRHVYITTDMGTTVEDRTKAFKVVPVNTKQQEIPGYGVPGGNSNRVPLDPHGPGGSNEISIDQKSHSTVCPVCGAHGTMHRQGDHYSCNRCGYTESVGGAASIGENSNFTTSPSTIQRFKPDQGGRRVFTHLYARNWREGSAITNRARTVLDLEENQ